MVDVGFEVFEHIGFKIEALSTVAMRQRPGGVWSGSR
jgi:hypothetical protein